MKISEFKIRHGVEDQAQRTEALHQLNRTETAYPKTRTIHGIFTDQACLTPHAVAVRGEGRELSYREIEERSNQLARFLISQGVGSGQFIGILLDRSPGSVTCMLGVLKAGAAYFAISPDTPVDRMVYLLDDSRTSLLIAAATMVEKCREVVAQAEATRAVLFFESSPGGELGPKEFNGSVLDEFAKSALPELARADSIAYLAYTSGSTGRPKGVLVEHRAVLRLVLNTNYIQLAPEDRILQTGSLSFDASTFEIWGALLNGASVCCAGQDVFLNPAALAEVVRSERITTMFLTTALFNVLADERPEIFATMKTVLTGGEKASPRHFNRVLEANPHLALLHVYGPTENTTFTTWLRVDRTIARQVPIGVPIANTTVYVLDANFQPANVGMPGELFAGGDGLARGYLNEPGLTAERFIPNPFAVGQRLYRTGDRVRWLREGNIEFLGRLDDQVKIRGFRIEPGEIEAHLRNCPGIKQCIVVAWEPAPSERSLAAYVTSDSAVDFERLRGELAKNLPDYMIPSAFTQFESLPLNKNGKVDRQALPVPIRTESRLSTAGPSPGSATEQTLQTIWEEVLQTKPVGVHDNFFEIGGHSLKATKLASLVHKRFGITIPLTAVYKAPTIREMANHLLDLIRFGVEAIDEPVVRLNGPADGNPIFGFPPASADALGYASLAKLLLPYTFYAFNFIESEDRLARYAEIVTRLAGLQPIVLFGYSGGGNLAHRVARELERQGKRVSEIVMLDSACFPAPYSFPEEESRRFVEQFLDSQEAKAYLTAPILKDKARRNIKGYLAYFSRSCDQETVSANIHLLNGEDSMEVHRDAQGTVICTQAGWAERTNGKFETRQGAGGHNTMLYPPFLESNARLLKRVFDQAFSLVEDALVS